MKVNAAHSFVQLYKTGKASLRVNIWNRRVKAENRMQLWMDTGQKASQLYTKCECARSRFASQLRQQAQWKHA